MRQVYIHVEGQFNRTHVDSSVRINTLYVTGATISSAAPPAYPCTNGPSQP